MSNHKSDKQQGNRSRLEIKSYLDRSPHHNNADELHDYFVQNHEEVDHQFSSRADLSSEKAERNTEHYHSHHVRSILVY